MAGVLFALPLVAIFLAGCAANLFTGEVTFVPAYMVTHPNHFRDPYYGTGVVTNVRQAVYASADFGRHALPKQEMILLVIRRGEWVGQVQVENSGTGCSDRAILTEGTVEQGDILIGKQYADKQTKNYITEQKSVGNWTASPETHDHTVEPTPTR